MKTKDIYVIPKRWTVDEVVSEDVFAVTVDEVKESARMDKEDNLLDDTIERYILTAQKRIEKYCGLTLFRTRFIGWYDSFPIVMLVEKKPFKEVQKIEYEDSEGVKVLDGSIYQVQKMEFMTNVFLRKGRNYPAIKAWSVDVVKLFVESGWDNAEDVPEDIKTAIVMSVVKMLQGDCGDNNILTKGAKDLLRSYRDELSWARN